MEEWVEIKKQADNCTKCSLYLHRKQAVLGDGNKKALLMLVGESPGSKEDEEGIPFTGKAGQLLTKALQSRGITRKHIYLTNCLLCRPWELGPTGLQRNRSPKPEELESCYNFLERQIRLVSPLVILCIGSPAAKSVIKENFRITTERGLIFNTKFDIPAIATVHPAYILRQHDKEYEESYQWLLDDIELARETTKKLNLASK